MRNALWRRAAAGAALAVALAGAALLGTPMVARADAPLLDGKAAAPVTDEAATKEDTDAEKDLVPDAYGATSGASATRSGGGAGGASGDLVSGDFTYTVADDGTATITGYSGSGPSLVFPASIGGKRVTAIWLDSVPNKLNVTSVTVPEGVTHIYSYTFYGFKSLTSVTLPSTLTYIGDEAFERCAFSSIELPSGLKELGSRAFWSCPNLTSLTIPAALEPMEHSVGYGGPAYSYQREFHYNPVVACPSFRGFKVAAGCKNYSVRDGVLFSKDGSVLYGYPSGLTASSYAVPQGTRVIASEAFVANDYLSQVSLPSGLEKICYWAFYGVPLTSVSLPDSVTEVQEGAFETCEWLTSARLSSGMKVLRDKVFSECTRLSSVTNASGIEQYGFWSFHNCSSLRSIEFGDKVKRIDGSTFDGCDSFTTPMPSYLTKTSSGNYVSHDETVYVSGTENYDYAKQVVELVNQERAKKGAAPVTIDAELTEAAMQRAAECALNFSHTRPDGEDCFSISARISGENIAAGRSTPAAVMDQWVNSPGHYSNIINSRWSSMGVGSFKVGAVTYWVQVFSESDATGAVPSGTKDVTATIKLMYDVVSYEGSGFNLNRAQENPEPLNAGETYELVVGIPNPGWDRVYCPTDAKGYTWTSSDTSIATVGSDGVVKAGAKAGKVTITATSAGGYTWSKTFEVSTKASGETPGTNPGNQGSSRVMYRLYNQWSGEHLYTSDASERDSLVRIGWTAEGEGWTAPASGDPVYRLYNPYAPKGDHHYTMSKNEYDSLVKIGWIGEGVGWYSAGKDGTPLYRLFNKYVDSCTHHYTTSAEERDALVKIGWTSEGIAWYGV